jgi:hypothetical protein
LTPESAVAVAENWTLTNVIAKVFPNHSAARERVSVSRVIIPSEKNSALKAWKKAGREKEEKNTRNDAETANHRNLRLPRTYGD